jgi:hypothetical protein
MYQASVLDAVISRAGAVMKTLDRMKAAIGPRFESVALVVAATATVPIRTAAAAVLRRMERMI